MARRVTETITITDREVVVSYRDADLYLTPEMEERLRVYWKDRIDRLTAAILGASYAQMVDGCYTGLACPNVPARESEPENPPKYVGMFPLGNVT